MAKHTLKILQGKHRKIFKVCLSILQYYAWKVQNTKCTAVCFSLKKTAENCILEWYMHGSLFLSENTAVYYILDSTELVFRKFGPTKI